MKIKIIFFFLFIITNLFSQNVHSGDISVFVDSLISVMPDSFGVDKNKYVSPSASDRANFATVITNIIAGQYLTAHTNASSFGYQLYEYTDNSVSPNKIYYALVKTSGSTNYWGSYIFNPNAERQRLVIQAPHPVYDTYTGAQAFYIFREVGARAFFITGAHRCNSTSATTCDGTSTVCTGSSAAFRISDQAHSDGSFFQRGTETLDVLITDLIVIQIHGFSKGVDDPDVIISNGTKINPSGTDYVTLIKNNLLVEDSTLTFKVPHVDTDWDRLNGTTNVQGRYINESGDPCETAPVSATGRFVHIEQKKDGLRYPSSNWSKLSNAIASSISLDPLPVELVSFAARAEKNSIILEWQTATEINNFGFNIERKNQNENWKVLSFVQGNGNSNAPKTYSYVDSNPLFGVVQYRLKQIDFDGKFEYSSIVEIYFEAPTNFRLEQNHPNPFNPSTVISYQIPAFSHVSLKVYDVLGREVATLVDQFKHPGNYNYEWRIDNSELSSGIYYYRLVTDYYTEAKKMILIK